MKEINNVEGHFIVNPENPNQVINFETNKIFEFTNLKEIENSDTFIRYKIKYVGETNIFDKLNKSNMLRTQEMSRPSPTDIKKKYNVDILYYDSEPVIEYLDKNFNYLGKSCIVFNNNEYTWEY